MRHGDFTSLAPFYKHRAAYSPLVLENLTKHVGLSEGQVVADVGAGTGKLTEQLLGCHSGRIYAVEPNDAMREEGRRLLPAPTVTWLSGKGEDTTLPAGSVDWVLMASSFHWVETLRGLQEFHRILKPDGYFTALWNPRNIRGHPLHGEIEDVIHRAIPNLTRVSSGAGKFTEDMFATLLSGGYFRDVIYLEALHEEVMTKERYMGIWHSVNDIPVQAGSERWRKILTAIETIVSRERVIVVPYRTRAWVARRNDPGGTADTR
jgi:ubiquinone/menaquinone biosynthesis C-methylase UbiE